MTTVIHTRKALLLAGAALVALPAWTALAQTIPGTTLPADATASAGTSTMDEIVVTARRRSETLQDVPVSVSAFTAEALDLKGSPDITALQQSTPNLTMQVARGSNSTLIAFIRGVGQQDPLWGFEPGVGLYVDDVYIARPQGAVLDIFDIERIEVLRGPQGTLYGRNTIGGAVKYVTRRIGDEASATLKLNVGSYEQRDVIGSFGTPIGDKVALGGAFAVYRRDGFGRNLTTGAEHYNKDINAGRLSLELTPTEDIFIRLAADKTDDRSNARHGHRERPFTVGAVTYPVLEDEYDTYAGLGDDNDVENKGVSLTGEWTVNDSVTLKSVTAYRKGQTDTSIDFDNLPQPFLDVPAYYKDDQLSQELQVLYEGEKLQGVAGLFYMDATASGAFDTIASVATTLTSGEVKTKSYAAFADASYEVLPDLSLSLGARYTIDDKEGSVFRAVYTGIRSPELGGTPRAPTQIRTDYDNDKTFRQFTPRASLSYKINPDLTVYGSYSKGFKSGGFDMRGDALLSPRTVEGYGPEKIESYELGAKGTFFDRLTLNAAGFYSVYKGQQISSQVAIPNTTPLQIQSLIENVGETDLKGFELEGELRILPSLTATGVVGYIDSKFKDFITYNAVLGQEVDVSDSRVLQNTPHWSTNFSLRYTHDLPEGAGALALTGTYSHRSAYSLFETPNPLLDENGYTLWDASLVWTSASDTWRVGLHGRNLGNARYRVGGYPFGAIAASDIGFYGPPRTYTLSLEARF
ncbi:TonB-dependent receptor [Oleisolibacter albus]|uniref:TonB-dependent receptor n=1 Tax=Oleisolibacter albus TaxID=2171757 RepID=UPI000DF15C4B|nr:TonB-dependent receptor [Oleisolibacter albus]